MSSLDSDYKLARARVLEKKKFHKSLVSFFAVNAFLLFINLTTFNGHWWFIYPLLGWGIGIAMQYYKAYVEPRLEDEAVQREMKNLPYRTQEERMRDDVLDLEELPKQAKSEAEAIDQKRWRDQDLV